MDLGTSRPVAVTVQDDRPVGRFTTAANERSADTGTSPASGTGGGPSGLLVTDVFPSCRTCSPVASPNAIPRVNQS